MSISDKIKILECNNLEDFNLIWNNINENQIVLLLSSNSKLIANLSDIDRIIKLFEDQKIGFVYTDAITINNQKIFNIEYLNGIDLPNIPFFAKKINTIRFKNISNENLMIDIMKNYMEHKYYFHHIADPLIKLNI